MTSPPGYTGTKPNVFKRYRKKVKLWLLFTRTPAQLQGPRVLSRLTGPAWDACDGLEPEDVATDDGVNVILDTLEEAFQGEHETELFHALEDTFCGPGRKKGERLHDDALRVQSNVRGLAKQGVRLPDQIQGFLLLRRANLSTTACLLVMRGRRASATPTSFCEIRRSTTRTSRTQCVCVSQAKEARVTAEEQEGDTDVETALAALNEDNDTDLEETDVQEILLAYKEPRQLRGEQQATCRKT